MKKTTIATISLGGCWGCHMSLLDIDEKIIELNERIRITKSSLTDIKTLEASDIGFIEGGCCNTDNVITLKEYRKHCKILISVGECAIMGGLPALRNNKASIKACLEEAYLNRTTIKEPATENIPDDPELPIILDRVIPCHEIVSIDHFLPGCPPSADVIYTALISIIEKTPLNIPEKLLRYD